MNKIIDFHAEWCGPCKLQKPILDKFAKENNIEVEYVDVDEHPEIAQKYNVRSVPTMVYLKNDEPIQIMVGLHKESLLKEKVLI